MADYEVYESSDDDSYESDTSDDELRCFIREKYGIKKHSTSFSKDFENEMEQELNNQMKLIENEAEEDCNKYTKLNKDVNKDFPKVVTATLKHSAISKAAKECNQQDASTVVTENKKSDSSAASISEDLMYDPEMDNEDQKWIDEQRRLYISPGAKITGGKHKPLPNSDAVLNCPACLSLLCLDCQRHEVYKSQYRAMFVKNCSIDVTQTLQYPQKKKSNQANKNIDHTYHPVKCVVCNTSVAVYDEDEVYHFFNVVSSFT